MKKILVVVFTLGLLLALVGYIKYNQEINKKISYNKIIEIKPGMSVRTALKDVPIAQTMPFRLYLKTRNNGKNIKAGYYEIRGEYSIIELIEKFETGASRVIRVTIPEGFSYKNIIELLEKDGKWSSKKIEEALKKIDFPYPTPNGNFEGYFYPATYYVPEYFNEDRLVKYILGHFLKIFPPEKYPDKEEFFRMLTLASIIEKEAVRKDEKPRISSVFHNRLGINMRLASDATVNYLYDYTKRRMLYKDLEIDSPYNTYKYTGLPPGPISSPDRHSVVAAFNPEKTDYLFFVARGDGYHHFTRTYKEHLDFQRENAAKKQGNK